MKLAFKGLHHALYESCVYIYIKKKLMHCYDVGPHSINLLLLHCISKITTILNQTSGKNFFPNS